MEILSPLPVGQDADLPPADPPPPLPEDLAFTPVPRRSAQRRLIDAAAQRAFIAHLAATGSVRLAAKAIGFTPTSLYPLRHHAQGASFAAAWDRAVGYGARAVLDTLMDHAINGTPETVTFPDGTSIERRRFNTRVMMWVVAHHFPESYASSDGLSEQGGLSAGLRKLKAKWHAEWQAEREAEAPRLPEPTEEEREDAERARAYAKDAPLRMLDLYSAKCREERTRRRAGDFPAADFAMRQLTHIELVLETLGHATGTCEAAFFDRYEHGRLVRPEWSTAVTRFLARVRRDAWAAETPAMPRPPENLYENGHPHPAMRSGPNRAAREKCRVEAEREMAAALVKWEACGTEEAWAAWREG